MGKPNETDQNQAARYENSHQDSTPAEIRRKVAAHRVYRREARRRGYLRAALFLAALSLAAPLVRHGRGLAHDCRAWLTHTHRGHHRHYAGRG